MHFMEGDNNPIYQWLSTVEQQRERRSQHAGMKQRKIAGADIVKRIPHNNIPLEIDAMHGSRGSTTRKRGAGCVEETETSVPECETHKRPRHSYEPRLRHKTREDRYEYKGPSSTADAQLQTRGKQAKRSRRRRHTMNDDFHASNVTGNRLTLRNNTNVGIFSKGRISSSTNNCSSTPLDTVANAASNMKARRHSLGSDHTFSEMSFLSQGNHPSLHPVSSVRDGPASQRERECRQEPQLEHHLCDRKLAMSHSSNNLCGVKRRLDTSHSPSFTVKGPNAREVSTDVHGFRNAASEPQTKRRKTSSRSPSVPYTSSESDVGGLDESRGIEQYLLDVLHAGLDHQALCSEDSKPVLARRYWSLSELWVLLWERQAFWSNETGNEKQASHEPTPEQPAAAEVTPEKLQENKFQNSASEPQTKRKKASSRSPSLRGMKRKLDTSHSPSFTVKEPNAREVSTDVHGFQNAASEPHTKRRKTSSRSPSVPYTSSESDVGGLDESRGIEQYLLDILHAGLGHQALCSEDSKPVLARRYWSLSELWVLLWERQPFWSNETGNEIQASHEPTPEQPAAAEVTPEKLQENDSPGIPDSVEASQSHTEMSNPTPKTMVETASTASSDGLEQHSVLGPQGNAAQEENEALQISDRKGYLNVASNVAEASNKQYFYTETWNEDNCESPLEGPGDDSASPAPTLEVQQVPVPNIDIYEISQIDDDDEFYHTLDVAYDEITSPGLMAKVANLQRSIAKNGLDGSRPQPTQNADYLDEFDVTEDTEEGEPKELATVSENTIQDNHGSRPPEPCQQHEEPLQYSNYPLFHQSNELSGEWPWLAREYAQPTFPSSPEINARLSRFPGIRGFWRQNRLY